MEMETEERERGRSTIIHFGDGRAARVNYLTVENAIDVFVTRGTCRCLCLVQRW